MAFKTLEDLANTLTADSEFTALSEQEQDSVFAELAKEIEAPQPADPGTIDVPQGLTPQEYLPNTLEPGVKPALAPALGMDLMQLAGALPGTMTQTVRDVGEGRGFHPLQNFTGEVRGGRPEVNLEQQRMKDATNLAVGMLPFQRLIPPALDRAGDSATSIMAKAQQMRPQPKLPLNAETLVSMPPKDVGKLPPAIKDLYLRERRTQLSQQLQAGRGELTASTQAAKTELHRLDRETLAHLNGETERVTKLLKDEAYQVALKLKTTDIGPLLKQQSTRYGDVWRSTINEISDKVPLIPAPRISAALEKRFAHNPKAFNLAYEHLKLDRIRDEFGTGTPMAFTPGQLANEVDRIGLTIQRSPTETYSFADDVADDVRDVLLDVIDEAASAKELSVAPIRKIKEDWRAWKPIQKRLTQGTRFFEQSETVTDSFVNKLVMYARTDRTKNNEKYFSEIQSYVGRDFAAPMRPLVEKLTAIERQTVAMEQAKAAEMERIGLQAQGARAQLLQQAKAGKRSITDLEITWAEKAERAKKFWDVLGKIGIVGGGVYGVNELRKLAR